MRPRCDTIAVRLSACISHEYETHTECATDTWVHSVLSAMADLGDGRGIIHTMCSV